MTANPDQHGCPGEATLHVFAEGGRVDALVAEHVASCQACADRVRQIEADNELLRDIANAGPRKPPESHPAPSMPEQIGAFRIVRSIGRGGFGEVYLARQENPIKRDVALKVIRAGVGSEMVVRRFEAERQALAVMDHPHVARIFDAGRTEDGLPYFVMEYVPGASVADHCRETGMDLEARLELFALVCDAVQHAHQKGVIHRDLKPSNVLVTRDDQGDHPKVIDFGIAKAIAQPLTEESLVTEQGHLVGTPEYMSPEQADSRADDIDTRADVYSLGVILYELLTGNLPFARERMRSASIFEVLRVIREEVPPKPSVRLAAESPSPAGGPPTGVRRVRGELDWIVMKCLEKDRERRYETAAAVALDVRRFMRHEPVSAGPPSASYRVTKFVERHRGVTVATAATAIAVIVGLAGTTYGLMRANAKQAELTAAQGELVDRVEELDQVARFQQALLADLDAAAFGREVLDVLEAQIDASLVREGKDGADRAAELDAFRAHTSRVRPPDAAIEVLRVRILEPALALIDERFASQLLVSARLRLSVAGLFESLGMPDRAADELRLVCEVRRQELGADHPSTLRAERNLGGVLGSLAKYDEAQSLLRGVLDAGEIVWAGEPAERAATHHVLATLHLERTQHERAAEHFRTAIELADSAGEPDRAHVHRSVAGLATSLDRLGQTGEAEQLLRAAIEAVPTDTADPDALVLKNNLAVLLDSSGRPGEAEPLIRQVYERRAETLGEFHPETITALNILAGTRQRQGDLEEASSLIGEVVRRRAKVFGEAHPETLHALNNLAGVHFAKNEPSEAAAVLERVVTGQTRSLPPGHQHRIRTSMSLGVILTRLGRAGDAVVHLRRAHGEASTHAPGSIYHAHCSGELAEAVQNLGDHEEARGLALDALRLHTQLGGPEGRFAALANDRLARIYLSSEDPESALEHAEAFHRVSTVGRQPDPSQRRASIELLASVHDALASRFPDAGHAELAENLREQLVPDAASPPAPSEP